MTELELVARPRSHREGIAWDPWRRCWIVACRAPPVGGAANEELVEIIARYLGVPASRLRWVRGTRGRRKVLDVAGLAPEEVHLRLATASRASPAYQGHPDANSERPASRRP